MDTLLCTWVQLSHGGWGGGGGFREEMRVGATPLKMSLLQATQELSTRVAYALLCFSTGRLF